MLDLSSLPETPEQRAAFIAAQEAELSAMCRAALRRIVLGAYDKFTRSLTAAGDLSAFDDIPGAWLTVVYDDIAPKVEELYQAGQVTAWLGVPGQPSEATARAFERVTNENAVAYMGDATNRLVGVGDTTWGLVKAKTTSAIASGMSNEDLKNEIGKVSTFSEYRADTIARTEANAAYVNGDLAGARALGADGPVRKTWRATFDNRTRDAHADADGQTVGMDESFDIDGEPMDGPHDPGASAGNVVNCRCYLEFLYPGDTDPDGNVLDEPELVVPAELSIVEPTPETSATPVMAEMGTPRTARYANIDAAAEKYGVSRAQVASYMPDGPKVAAAIKAEAASTAADSFAWLDRFEGLQLQRPPKGARGGEYDWLERLAPKERARLSSGNWYTDSKNAGIDIVFDEARRVGAVASDASLDDFMDEWLYHTRVIDGSKSLRAGRWPDTARFGGFDPVDLAPSYAEQGIDISKVIGKDRWDQAGYLAERGTAQASEDAYRALGADRITGTAPWRQSFTTWRDEVGHLEYEIDNGFDVASNTSRLRELVPFDLDSGQDYESLYAEIVETAKIAQVDVADWAEIPWATGE